MIIQLLYCLECPSHEMALERLREAVAAAEIAATIETHLVRDGKQAEFLRFKGSPTFRVAGKDLFSEQETEMTSALPFGLNCRAYLTDAGRISPLPTKSMLVRSIRAAAGLN